MRPVHSLVVLALALGGCGGGKDHAGPSHDAGNPDTTGVPPPPTLGAQIDRLGRPAISTLLVATLADPGPATTAQKDLYNQAADAAMWKTTTLRTNVSVERELEANLAVFDVIDTGLSITQAGCGNAMRYTRPASPTSYQAAADLLADDQIYVDTSKATCTVYLALEIEQASSGTLVHNTCGGRTPTHDVIDVSYSVLAAGTFGLDPANDFSPRLGDGVGPHADVKDTFPFLGAPH